jgi:hypothetical protein
VAVGGATLVCGRDLTWSGEVPAAAGTGAMIVVPDTGLVDGQPVEVRMMGFPAGGSVGSLTTRATPFGQGGAAVLPRLLPERALGSWGAGRRCPGSER